MFSSKETPKTYPYSKGIDDLEPIRIDRVYADPNPEIKETRCSCGGTLRYGSFLFSTFLNLEGHPLEVKDIHGYTCDNEACSTVLFPPEVGDELDWRIDKATGSLTFFQKLEGDIKGYSSEPPST